MNAITPQLRAAHDANRAAIDRANEDMTYGYFITDNDTGRAVAHYPTMAEAQAAHEAIEPVASRPDRPWPQMWHYMIEAERGPNDCRQDLYGETLEYFSQLHTDNRAAIEIALRLAAPKRADAGRYLTQQDDASDCPLFRAANEPRLL